jgi:uroporphyrinogen-III synthase
VLFYSTSAVAATSAALPPGFLHGVPAVAIGPATAAACLRHGMRLAAQAASPGLPGILAALRQVLPGPEASHAKE